MVRKARKILLWSTLLLLLAGAGGGYYVYRMVYSANTNVKNDPYFFIATGATYEEVLTNLKLSGYINDITSFDRVAKRKQYDRKVRPGRYKIRSGMNNNELVNMLRAGLQEPVMVTFNNIRWKEQLAGRVSRNLEADSASILALLSNEDYLQTQFGFNSSTILTMFLPDSYQFNWNTSAEEFMKRMASEYKKFWNDARKKKATDIGLSQSQVSILASIVQEEQQVFADERPVIAGLYLNRLRQKHPLESDPTLMYAHGDFSIRRVLNKHKEIDSPYNTYKNTGLPPGPLNIPDISSIDAVLNYETSDYFFMCAKDDFSGRHNFATSYDEHLKNAKKYQAALDKRGIKK
ncbi:MAG: endolytic transglycosylase MltG [Bacteroidia bacterium]|nr:endolytic transglycosylase MltG [Bacteroidia bacterium]